MDLEEEIKKILSKRHQDEKHAASLEEQQMQAVEVFIADTVSEAFGEFSKALEANGRDVSVTIGKAAAKLVASKDGSEEFSYSVERQNRDYVAPVIEATDRKDGKRYRATGYFRSSQTTVHDLKKDEIVKHMLKEYKRHVSFLGQS